ncbi:diguanylate cyclase [Agarivorans sp. B2Z047]|uniref:sensor domain-containing diguanylate cyclase n=1 Tax=Agarivorans sp. B2Z047 TaxID=2652721 RepID=UPI00128D6C51|nr:sensor domain-containing diguanylate cyclase [Agarivorans sp. B2Z047]MPW29760.1 diguanylate cyclase [Agarivorans sp. B2Z047]UQN43327.1 sensor domain-containing diguanylate cyclase [Agarivorans sp. B2Z047]
MKGAFKLRTPIAKRLVILIVSASTLFALLSVAVQLAFNFSGAVKNAEQWVDEYNQANLSAIERAVWEIDYQLLDDLLQGFVQQQYVSSVNFSTDEGMASGVGEADLSQKFYVYSLDHQGTALGKLTVGLDLSLIKQDIKAQALVILLTNGLKTFLMSLIILLLVGRIVTGDLRRLAEAADQIFTEEQQIVQLPSKLLKRNDEIGLVASSMQQLQQRLQRGLDARLEAEQQLHQHRQVLEETVEQRTSVLNWQTEANQLLSEISLSFLNQTSSNSKALLQRATSAIGSLFPIERVVVLEFERQQAIYRDVWSVPGHLAPIEPVDLSQLSELKRRLVSVAPIVVSDVEKLKRHAPAEYQLLKQYGIKSFVGIPLSDGNKAFGLLNCVSLSYCAIWDDYQVVLLSQFAAAISGLLINEKNDQAMNRLQNELLQVNERLQVLAETDELTGLVNRRPFKRELNRAVTSARRHKTQLAVLMADIDYFKAYNDHYGHVQGDEALKLVAKALTEVVKRSEDCVARVGGEEFAILVSDANQQELPKMAEQVVKEVAKLQIEHADSQVSAVLTISVGGILIEPDDVIDPTKLLELADSCLYKAKHQGRNQAVLDLDV